MHLVARDGYLRLIDYFLCLILYIFFCATCVNLQIAASYRHKPDCYDHRAMHFGVLESYVCQRFHGIHTMLYRI